jgi:predicted enzyme related to lactoylglutathione lyase
MKPATLLGLRTAVYYVTDLGRAKDWYESALGIPPYFDEPFYVGFNIAGYELGLNPDHSVARPGPGGAVAYWRVADIERAVEHFQVVGAALRAPIQNVGGGIRVAEVTDPFGNMIGLIENPQFQLPQM